MLKLECETCGKKSSLAARYCQWCGEKLRELEPFEEPLGAAREVESR